MEVVIDPNGVETKLLSQDGYLDRLIPLGFGTVDACKFHFPPLWNENAKDWRVGVVGHCPSFVAEVIVHRCPSFLPQF